MNPSSTVFLETERCVLTPFTLKDVDDAASFFGDPAVMYAWEHDFTQEEIRRYVEKSIAEHARWGYSLMMARLKGDGCAIGRVGLRNDRLGGRDVCELGYILARRFWGKGYATELGRACLFHAFRVLDLEQVVAVIRPENLPSIAVAKRLGMMRQGQFIKPFMGKTMLHDMYALDRRQWQMETATS